MYKTLKGGNIKKGGYQTERGNKTPLSIMFPFFFLKRSKKSDNPPFFTESPFFANAPFYEKSQPLPLVFAIFFFEDLIVP